MKPWLIAILFGAALLAGLAVSLITSQPPAIGDNVTVLNTPRPVPDVTLTTAQGERFSRQDFAGQWHLLFFGFTNCPDICPTTLAEMAALAEAEPTLAAQVRRVFVSVDPQRDSPEKMRQYTDFFDPSILVLTGTEAQINTLTDALGIPHAQVPLEDSEPGAYTVDHSASMVVLNPQAKIAAYISPPHTPTSLARDLKAILAGAQS